MEDKMQVAVGDPVMGILSEEQLCGSDGDHPTSTTAPLYLSGDDEGAEVDAGRTEVAMVGL